MTFLAGLLVFVIDTQVPHLVLYLFPHHSTFQQHSSLATWVVSGFAIFCLMGLGSVTFWFAWEKLDHHRERLKRQRQNFEIPGHEALRQRAIYYTLEAWSRFIYFVIPRHPVPSEPQTLDAEKQEKTVKITKGKALWNTAIAATRRALPESQMRQAWTAGWQEAFQKLASADARVHDLVDNSGRTDSFRHICFSPSGDWLAAINKAGCCIFKMRYILRPDSSRKTSSTQMLSHRHGDARQSEWSPDGKRLLTLSARNLKIWGWDEDEEDVRFHP